MKWYWEKRGNNEYTSPQIATFLQGWEKAKGDIASTLEPTSEVFVREVVQNFVDASRDNSSSPAGQKPSLTFSFLSLTGKDAQEMLDKLDVQSIRAQYLNIENPEEMRLPESDLLSSAPTSIRLLVLSESGTSGMYGHWDRSSTLKDAQGNLIKHKMRDALLAAVRASAGKGLGSFGEGKKAVIGISKVRSLLAYTCFDPSTSEDGTVSRRFMGGTYWQNYIVGDELFSGFGMIGGQPRPNEERPAPYTNDAADDIVRLLNIPGLEVRSPGDVDGFGTTMVFLDPNITANDVAIALARNWWPLIEEGGADFAIYDESGSEVQVEYSPEIQVFVDAYKSKQSHAVSDWSAIKPGEVATKHILINSTNSTDQVVGTLKLSIDLAPVVGFSRRDLDSNWSNVALIRDGMLITYQHAPRSKRGTAPFVRGVFVVKSQTSPDSEEKLRRTEPPLHNKWLVSGDLDKVSRALASDVYVALDREVEVFRQEHIAANARLENELELFREHLSISGNATGKVVDPVPPKSKTPWAMLADSAQLHDAGAGRRYVTASRVLQLAASGVEPHKVRVELGWEALEDGTWKKANASLIVGPISEPQGFDLIDGSFYEFEGTVTQAQTIFEWQSAPYRELWTLRPYMIVTSLEGEIQNGSSEQ